MTMSGLNKTCKSMNLGDYDIKLKTMNMLEYVMNMNDMSINDYELFEQSLVGSKTFHKYGIYGVFFPVKI